MAHVYGDSTPFPYDLDYIDLLRGAVDCAVQLLSAQHAIDTALDRSEGVSARQRAEQSRLDRVTDNVEQALRHCTESDLASVANASQRIVSSAQGIVSEEVRASRADALNEIAKSEKIIARAREASARSVEALLVDHDIPETGVCLQLEAKADQYRCSAVLNTPFGVSAVCPVQPPVEHEWSKLRRVRSLSPETVLYLPRCGRFTRRTTLAATPLDRLFISDVVLDETHALLTVLKRPRQAEGYRIGIAYEQNPRAVVSQIDKNGALDAESAITLGGRDNASALRLMRRVGETTRDLVRHRRAVTSMVFDNQPVAGVDEPGAIARRLIAIISPIAQETARRSGAPGELVVRRDIGDGRREELYVTKNELLEKTQILPPELQAEFAPLGIAPPVRPAAVVRALN